MPLDTIMVIVGVVAMFATFAVTMLWADYQTRPAKPDAQTKRRPF